MPKIKKICKVCGKQYIACATPNKTGAFRWRDVACSPECGIEYLDRFEKAKAETQTEKENAQVETRV